MIFSSIQYLVFLPIVVLLYWRTKGGARTALLVVASYIFYMSWFPIYGLLLLALTAINWLISFGLDANSPKKWNEAARKALLAFGLILNLGCLFYYKYANFLITNVFAVFNMTNSWLAQMFQHGMTVAAYDAPVLKVMLPLGISFFVFEFVHYIVDVYKGSNPIKSFNEFAVFASFFPSQIAGPIKRYQDFNDRLHAPEPWSKELFFEGMTLIVQGMFKKVAIADPIGMIVFGPFALSHTISCADALIAMVGFFVQVYCDFSGYTDIGRGSALLLGIRLPENFELPYLSHDISDFWRRWHMSLGTWLRDYIYIPLGGSRVGRFVNWRNLFVTMTACGLWHGASWHYVVFGALQGLGLIVNREWKLVLKSVKPLANVLETAPGKAFGTFLTASFITLTFAVFRAPDMPRALNILSSLGNFTAPVMLWSILLRSAILQLITLYAGFWLVSEMAKRRPQLFGPLIMSDAIRSLQFSTPVRLASWTCAAILTIAARPTDAVPFVYFQF